MRTMFAVGRMTRQDSRIVIASGPDKGSRSGSDLLRIAIERRRKARKGIQDRHQSTVH